jgi:hypothetical protein
VNIGHACPRQTSEEVHGLDLPREQDTPDDPMQGNASYMIRPILSVFLLLLFSTRRRLSFPQLIITLFYCPTGLAAYILFCRFFVVLLYFNLYIGIPAVFPDTEILDRKDYTFYRSLGLPFTPFRFLTLAGSPSLDNYYTLFPATTSILHDQRPSCLHQRTR